MAKKKKKGADYHKQKNVQSGKQNVKQDKPKSVEQKKQVVSQTVSKPSGSKSVTFAFNKENYRWLLIGLAFIFIGFILMIGGGSDDPNVFNDEIFNFQRLTLAPILILIGYVIEIFAIMRKPKN